MPNISVIVPVYQVEAYLERCLDSVKRQTYPVFECILVDDGSTDSSGTLCDRFAASDPRFTVIHKKNGGLSSARNAALEIVRGTYICFLDSDDVLHPQALELMLAAMEQNGADLVCAPLQEFSSPQPEFSVLNRVEQEVLECSDFIDHLLPENFGRICVTACGKLYRREIFRTLRYPEGKIYEDLCVYLDVLLSCKKIAILDAPLYYYYKNPASITHSNYLAHDRFGEFQVREEYIGFFEERGLAQQVQYALNDYLTFFLRNAFAVQICYPQRKALLKKEMLIFRSHLNQILKNPCVCRMRKICAVGILVSPRLVYPLAKRTIPDCLIEEMR